MAQQQLYFLAKKQLLVQFPMMLLLVLAILAVCAGAAAECSASTTSTSKICNEQQLPEPDDQSLTNEQQQPDDLSLFQRGHQLTKMPPSLGLIGLEVPGGAPPSHRLVDLGKWISADVSSVIDLLFLVLIGAMFLRWRQNQNSQGTEQRKGVGSSAGSKQRKGAAAPGRAEKEEQPNAKKPLELHAAVVKGEIAACEQALAKAGVSVEEKDCWLCTPLHVAAHRGNVPVMEWLLTHRARVNTKEAWDQTPLHFAAQAGHTRACEILVGYGADLSAADALERTALLLAGEGNHVATAESLLRMGATLGNTSESKVPALLNNLILCRMFEDIGRGGKSSSEAPTTKPVKEGRAGAGLDL